MKKIYQKFIPALVFLAFLSPFSAYATHVMGADITWKALGNDSFELIVHGYRDCNGIQLSGTYLTYQTTADTCISSPKDANPNVCCGVDITPICSNTCDRCISNPSCVFPYGIEEFTISSTVYLPPPCCNYTIAWQESARSSAITTGAANNNFYEEAYINRCIQPYVSSPFFTEPPVTIFCVDQCVVYNPGVDDDSRDAAGRADSLSYSFGTPYSDKGSPISYTYPYTNTAPLIYYGSSPNETFSEPNCYGFHLDSTTGDIKFRAKKADVSVMVLVVDIFRRDSLGTERNVGEIRRDIEIIALKCPTDQAPIIPGINGDTSYSIKICAGHETCFNLKSFDLDTTDTVKISWNSPPSLTDAGATFTVVPDGKKWPTALFCWYPTSKDMRTYPYNFVVTAKDNICPVPGMASKSFSIYVVGSPPIADYTTTVQNCRRVDFKADMDSLSPSSIASYVWTIDSTLGHKPVYINGNSVSYEYQAPGTYYYTLTVTGPGGCPINYQDSITIPKFPIIKLPADTSVCLNSSLKISAIPSDFKKPYTITWNTGDSLAIINPAITKDTTLIVSIKDATGCSDTASMNVKTLPLPSAISMADSAICTDSSIALGATSANGVNYQWTSNPSGFTSTVSNPKITPTATAIYKLTQTLVSDGCSRADSETITVSPFPTVIAGQAQTICLGGSTVLGDSTTNAALYAWTSNPAGFSSTLANPTVTPNKTTVYYLRGINPGNCISEDSVTIKVSLLPSVIAGKAQTICLGASTVLGDSAVNATSYTWTSNPAGFSSRLATPIAMPSKTTIYYVTGISTKNCILVDTVTITVNPLPDAHWTAINHCDSIFLFPVNSSNESYLWDFGNGDSSHYGNPIYVYNSKGTYSVKLMTTSNQDCESEYDSSITISCLSNIDEYVDPDLNLTLYPNPFDASFTLEYNLSETSKITVSLFDITGRQVGLVQDATRAPRNYSLNVSAEKYHLIPGIYVLKIMTDNGFVSRQIVKM